MDVADQFVTLAADVTQPPAAQVCIEHPQENRWAAAAARACRQVGVCEEADPKRHFDERQGQQDPQAQKAEPPTS